MEVKDILIKARGVYKETGRHILGPNTLLFDVRLIQALSTLNAHVPDGVTPHELFNSYPKKDILKVYDIAIERSKD